jgi:hypothetical protein
LRSARPADLRGRLAGHCGAGGGGGRRGGGGGSGGGGRGGDGGGGGGGGFGGETEYFHKKPQQGNVRSVSELASALQQIDGRQYPAYKDLTGAWDFGNFVLLVDHVQGDAFAAPSRMRVQVSQ